MCEHPQFIKTSVNIFTLYILFVIISINYVITESRIISVNTTETLEEDTSDINYELILNETEHKTIYKDTKRKISDVRPTRKFEKTDQRRPTFKNASSSKATKPPTSKPTEDISSAIWCFCNIASCVPNGYMCKSTIGACYSKSIERIAQSQQAAQLSSTYYDASANFLTRGCVEFLSKSERRRCVMKLDPLGDSEKKLYMLNSSDILGTDKRGEDIFNKFSNNNVEEDYNDLQCCNQDVCNYEVSQPVFVVRKSDDSHSSSMNSRFEWFRSATIAVSVAGLVILTMLIIVAGRLLASDAKAFSYKHQVTRDLRSRTPYYVERTLTPSESGSILCAKSLQREDLATLCGLQPTKSPDCRSSRLPKNRCPFAVPVSAISSCSTIDTTSHLSSITRTCDFDLASPEEMEPLNNRDSNHFLLDSSFRT